jgi:hypothetical protein
VSVFSRESFSYTREGTSSALLAPLLDHLPGRWIGDDDLLFLTVLDGSAQLRSASRTVMNFIHLKALLQYLVGRSVCGVLPHGTNDDELDFFDDVKTPLARTRASDGTSAPRATCSSFITTTREPHRRPLVPG